MKKYPILVVLFVSIFLNSNAQNRRKGTCLINAPAKAEKLQNESKEFASWQNQLDFVMNEGGHEAILTKNGMRLLRYTLTSDQIQPIAGSKISENTFGVIPLNEQTIENNFEIDRLRKRQKLIDTYNYRKKTCIAEFEELNQDKKLKVVKLDWDYKGKLFSTKCIISETFNTVVYDDILSNITKITVLKGE